jgi:alpha-beta hydrolase superfamily lysophospholipase
VILARLLTLLLLLTGAACAPVMMPAGAPVAPPAIAEDAFVTPDGVRLPYRAWLPEGPPRAVILALHGFGDYSVNFFELPAPLFTQAGVAIYAYDQRGFGAGPHRGLWASSATLAADAATAASLLRARHPGVPLYLAGESMGGAVVLVAATSSTPPPVDGYILLAPGVRGRATLGRLERASLEFFVHAMPMLGIRGSAPGFRPTDNEAAMRRWANDPLTAREYRVDMIYGLVNLMDDAMGAAPRFDAPALILYGGGDRIVPSQPIVSLLAALPQQAPQRIGYYPEGNHLLLRDMARARVAEDVIAWMEAPWRPLPSGADSAARRWLAGRVPN